jgi:NAD(P)-dependent dehydrogenase (short-subunit alcohol dehydrogenase family)
MPVTYDLNGKTAVVTGGAKGIGKAIVERLSHSGAQVHVWDLNQIELNSVKSTKVGVTDRSQIAQAIKVLSDEGSKIDILVNERATWECSTLSTSTSVGLATHHSGEFDWHDAGHAIGPAAYAPVGRRTHCEYGFARWKRGIGQARRLLGRERRSRFIHESIGT